MVGKYPYPRFYRFKEEGATWFKFRVWLLTTRRKFSRRWKSFKWTHLGGQRRYIRQHCPIRPYSIEMKEPVASDAKIRGCRTIHGPATILWDTWSKASARKVTNAKLPDGSRGPVWSRMYRWRRSAKPPLMWVWGQIEIATDDVVFLDDKEGLRYQPDPERDSQLERELASCKDFIEALRGDQFAVVAYRCLKNFKWMKIGDRSALDMNGDRSIGAMIAGLRGKGEDYLDYYAASDEIHIHQADEKNHSHRMLQILRKLGWRTYSEDELRVLALEEFKLRVARRLAAWKSLDELEARPAALHPKLDKKLLIRDILLYTGDNPDWLTTLSAEEQVAIGRPFEMIAGFGALRASHCEGIRSIVSGILNVRRLVLARLPEAIARAKRPLYDLKANIAAQTIFETRHFRNRPISL